jgi:tRNA(Ile)-lysidine synthase
MPLSPADERPDAAVRRAVEAAGGWPSSILAAVSGGLDSTVLLDVLLSAAPPAVRVGAAHLDHGWRGAEGGRDAALLERLCRRRGVAFHRGALDGEGGRLPLRAPYGPEAARPGPAPRRASLEAAAREARYAFLAGVACREGFSCIATGHTLDDQLETLLLRLERGGREEGLAGILSETTLHGVRVLRPLLTVPRAAIEAWAEARALPFREDATNADPAFARNRLRRTALPRLPRREAASLAAVAGLRRRLVEAAASRIEPGLVRGEPGRARLSAARLAGLPSALRREVLRRAFRRVAAPGAALGERSLDQVERLLASPAGGVTTLRGARARVEGGAVVLEAGALRRPRP